MSTHHWGCCCEETCCSVTSYAITSLPSISYTLTCGSNKEYTNGGGNTFNLNGLAIGVLSRANVALPVPTCQNPCYWFTPSSEYQYSGNFYSRCAGANCGQTWSYYSSASITIYRDNQNPSVRWARCGIEHTWYTTASSGPCVMPVFSVGVYYKLQLSGLCPDGTYAAYTSTPITLCNSATLALGTYTSIGTGGPSVTFGTPSGSLVVA